MTFCKQCRYVEAWCQCPPSVWLVIGRVGVFCTALALLALFCLSGCAPGQIKTQYVGLFEKCAAKCAPFEVNFAAEDDDNLYCACADGTKTHGPRWLPASQ